MKRKIIRRTIPAFILILSLLLLSLLAFTACMGKDGVDGANGMSAYEIALQNGFEGSEEEWLASLKGENGINGKDGINGTNGSASSSTDVRRINEALLASVAIYCSFERNTSTVYSAGSGVIYDMDKANGNAYIITNYHVIYSNSATSESKISGNIRVYLYGMFFDGTYDMDNTGIKAEYVGGSMTYDIAVLKISNDARLKNSDAMEIKIADSTDVTVGTTAIAIGNAEGLGISVTSGVVSIESESITMTAVDNVTSVTQRVMRIDTAVNSGNSGGGLFNATGELIGIVNAKVKQSDVENIGYAIPSNIAIGVARNIIDNCDGKDNKTPLKCLIGITVVTVDTRAEYNAENGTITLYDTVAIQNVSDTSIAKGVIEVGDILHKIKLGDNEEKLIRRQYELVDTMLDARVGDTVTLTVLRNGEEVVFTCTLTEDNLTAAY